MFESLQKHVLCNIPGIVQVPKEASQSTEDSPRVPAHQFFECVSVSPLNSDDNCSIWIVRRSGIGNQTGWAGRRIQIFSREDSAGREIGHWAQSSLQSVEKIGHCCHCHGFQDLRFAEPVCLQGYRVEPRLQFGWAAGQFSNFIQQIGAQHLLLEKLRNKSELLSEKGIRLEIRGGLGTGLQIRTPSVKPLDRFRKS